MIGSARPDYLSLVNKSGSGFNVSELVTAIVSAEIDPNKSLQNELKGKNEVAISEIGYLLSNASETKSSASQISDSKYFSLTSSIPSAVVFEANDETKITAGVTNISDVQIAKKMVFELPGFTDLTSNINQDITFNFGSWTQTSVASSTTSSSVEVGKTYKVMTRTVVGATDGDAFDEYTRDPDDTTDADAFHGLPIEVNDEFRASQGFSDGNYTFQEIDAFSFAARSGNSPVTLSLSGTLETVVKQLNAVSGVEAKLIKTNSTGTDTYSVVISSESTGLTNGFQITAGGNARWETGVVPSRNSNNNAFSQLSRDASLKVNNVSISRSSNTISDAIDGTNIILQADSSTEISLTSTLVKNNVLATVKDTISNINSFIQEMNRLTYVDADGDNDGALALDSSIKLTKRKFKEILYNPISGYGSNNIYLSQLGIKTNRDGTLYFDSTTFEKTYSNNPNYFNSLKDNMISTSAETASATKSIYTNIDPGIYSVSHDGTNWLLGSTTLTRIDYNGGSRFTSSTYAGLVIDTVETNPASFDVYIGKSFSEKVSDYMDDILSISSSIKKSEETYKDNNIQLNKNLIELEEREKLLINRYTKQFGSMESAMSGFNSTKNLLDNFIEAWKKQK